jgi:putative lipoprotein
MHVSRMGLLALSAGIGLGLGVSARAQPSPSGMPAASPTVKPSASTSATPAPSLSSGSWSLLTLDGAKLSLPAGAKAPSLRFDAAEKRVSGTTGCNVIVGSYDANGESLKFSPLATTRMACAAPLDGIESRFLHALEKTNTYRIGLDASEMELLDGETLLATFKAVR